MVSESETIGCVYKKRSCPAVKSEGALSPGAVASITELPRACLPGPGLPAYGVFGNSEGIKALEEGRALQALALCVSGPTTIR
jgi:hypothetical protein